MLTTAQVAKQANVAHNTVRNYVKRYGELVSADARGENGPRLFNDADMETICTIAALLGSGVPPAEIVERIRNQDTPPIIDIQPSAPPLQEPATGLQESQDETYALQVVSNSLQTQMQGMERAHDARLQAMERRQEAQAAEYRALHRDRVLIALWAFTGGLVAALVILGVAWLLVNGGT